VWLNADLVSAYDYWQYWRNTEDGDVGRFLKLFTVLPLNEIGRLAGLKGNEINEAKKVLATEATALVHGHAAADQAAETARKTFEEGAPAETLPTVEVENGIGILNAAVATGAVPSTSEARRQIKSGGIKLNGVVVVDEKMTLTNSNAAPEGVHILSFGKKRHFQIKRK
jgi:tyrosyl-tRNA synthetase